MFRLEFNAFGAKLISIKIIRDHKLRRKYDKNHSDDPLQ